MRRLSVSILALSTVALVSPSVSQAQLVVSDVTNYENVIGCCVFLSSVDSTNGGFLDHLEMSSVQFAFDLEYGPDGQMYLGVGYWPGTAGAIASLDYDGIEYTGGLVGTFTAGDWGANPLVVPQGIAWGFYGGQNILYVHDGTGKVHAYDAAGNYLNTPFAHNIEVYKGRGLAVAPDGKTLYVPVDSNAQSYVYRVDGQTGDILDDPYDGDDTHFVDLNDQSASGYKWRPYDVTVGPNGDIYLSAQRTSAADPNGGVEFGGGAIFRIRPDSSARYTDGTVIQSVQYDGTPGDPLNAPRGITFGDDGMLYVMNVSTQEVTRFSEDLTFDPFDSTFSTIPENSEWYDWLEPYTGPLQTGHNFLTFVPTACRDGVDNDEDGQVDLADAGCTHPRDNAETDGTFACDDGVDNDGDGYVDSADPGCADADGLETSPDLECDDGIDNDGDGRIDFDPATFANPGDASSPPGGEGDPGCKNPSWAKENPQCDDDVDNDGKAGIDYYGFGGAGPDPQCAAPWQDKEAAIGGRCIGSISPIESVHGVSLAVALLLLAFLKPDPRRRSSQRNH